MPHSQVTRVEIADSIGNAFIRGSADRNDIVGCAVDAAARPQVIAALSRLPHDHTYPTMRDIWKHLEGIPVETASVA